MKKSQKISSIMPEGEGIAQVFTLDQLCMNPDNPRKSRNPRYDDIKASVRSQGLNSIPLVTRDPRLPEGMWTFSDGGNTRYAIMRELWNETGDPRFYRMTCVVKPWAGRFQCLTGHLVENETHGQLTFIDKALSVQDARQLLEDERGKKVSLRELAVALAQHGLPVHYSSVSRMEDVIRHIYPWMPELLRSGFGGQELRKLIKLRSSAESVWEKFQAEKFVETKEDFTSVFGQCCRKFDSPDLWSLEMFTDELIGDLTEAFPCEELNYDGWLLELKCNRQPDAVVTDKDTPFVTAGEIMSAAELDEGNPENVSESDWPQSDPSQYAKERSPASPKPSEPDPVKPEPLSVEYSTAHDSSEQPENTPDIFWADPDSQTPVSEEISGAAEQQDQLIPDSLWHVNALQDDIDHLQSLTWRLCWKIASAHGCGGALEPACDGETAPGYQLVSGRPAPDVAHFLASLAGASHDARTSGFSTDLLIGSYDSASPVFDDEQTLTLFRLIRILRRLRELQRLKAAPVVTVNEG